MDIKDKETLYKAMLARDKRFDGRFYIGVKTTGIYCRPICPARPKKENVNFYRSQTEAENAGFRPCLRCRPDISPGAQMWDGTAAVVGRALKMISSGEADAMSLQTFATKLGITDRHLRRLFEDHLGASPVDIAISKRLHLARQLLSETSLPITEVAFASGFNSIRRFNEAFKKKYKRSPRDYRQKSGNQNEDVLKVCLPFIEPYDWSYVYEFLDRHSTFGLEHFEDGKYHRLAVVNNKPARLTIERDSSKAQLLVEIEGANVADLRGILAGVRNLFDLDHNPYQTHDSKKLGGIRIPGSFDPFETAIGIILGQLVSTEQAKIKIKKLVEHFGNPIASPFANLTHSFPSPKVLSAGDLTPIGSTKVRSESIRELSKKVASGEIVLSRTAPLQETREKLLAIKGIGPWTVEMISMRCLGNTNAFPDKDLIIKRAVEKLKLDSETWHPWRSYVTHWIWKNYAKSLSMKGQKKCL
ncbi:MAG: DNA-3-methyladenine glycosylase 2 family protein [Pseudobdellovibrionaceae bacterium]